MRQRSELIWCELERLDLSKQILSELERNDQRLDSRNYGLLLGMLMFLLK